MTTRLAPTGWAQVLKNQPPAAWRASALARVAYFFPAFWILAHTPRWQEVAFPRHADLLWPVKWLAWFEIDQAGPALLGLTVVGSLVGALAAEFRWARLIAFVCLLEFLGLKFAYGKIHHLMHSWLLVLFVFIFFPRGWTEPSALSRAGRHSVLLVFCAAQLLTALTYALSGVGKMLGIVYQLWLGQVTSLHPSSLARHLADRMLQTNEVSLWGPWMIEHGAWLWPMMLGTLYIQLFAIQFAARPHLHRWLGVGLVGFHAVTALSLTIDFTPAVMLIGLLFVVSPLSPPRVGLRSVLLDLPVFGPLAERWVFRGRTSEARSAL